MVPFHILFYGFPVDNFEYILTTALNESILYHDLFNFTVHSVRWANYEYTIDGLTNRTPQGTLEYQFAASTVCTRLYNYLNSSRAHTIVLLEDVLPITPHIYTSTDIAWIAVATIISVATIAFIVWLIRLPHKNRSKAIRVVNYEFTHQIRQTV